jgi:hypothetical protein
MQPHLAHVVDQPGADGVMVDKPGIVFVVIITYTELEEMEAVRLVTIMVLMVDVENLLHRQRRLTYVADPHGLDGLTQGQKTLGHVEPRIH